jgi:hypothetical protein
MLGLRKNRQFSIYATTRIFKLEFNELHWHPLVSSQISSSEEFYILVTGIQVAGKPYILLVHEHN